MARTKVSAKVTTKEKLVELPSEELYFNNTIPTEDIERNYFREQNFIKCEQRNKFENDITKLDLIF